MADGIWINDHQFVSFAEMNSALLSELATREAATGSDPASMLGQLPDPDPVLVKHGGGYDVLENLTADDQVCMAMQTRKLKTLEALAYEINAGAPDSGAPTGEALRVRKALVEDLSGINLYHLVSELLDAPFYGYTPVELIWRQDNGMLRLVDLVAKPREWFGWSSRNQLAFLRMGTPEPVNDYKFCVARHFPTFKNPYGLRLLSRVLWPVAFKKGGIRFWSKFCEKFGIPWVVAKARQGAQKKERQEMLSDLSSMVQDAVAVITSGSEVNIHETSGKAGDLHKAFVDKWDAAISKVLMGQTLTAEVGDKGAYAASKTHESVLDAYAAADRTLIKTFFDDLAWCYTRVNSGPDTATPVFDFLRQKDARASADLAKTMTEAGARPTKIFFIRHCGLAEDEFDMSPGTPATGPAAFAEGDDGDEGATGQADIDAMIDQVIAEAGPVAEEMAGAIKDAIDKAENWEDLQLLLAEAMADLPTAQWEDIMSRALVAADMFGRFTVADELKAED